MVIILSLIHKFLFDIEDIDMLIVLAMAVDIFLFLVIMAYITNK